MNDIANTNDTGLSRLEGLAMQARTFAQGAAMNLLQLGRVLDEARPLVNHGEWAFWVRQNAKMSVRTAEQYMQAYREFGLNPQIAELGSSQVIKLLPMTPEERDKLLSENDVSSMTTRQLDEAIRAQREQIRSEAMREAEAALTKAHEADFQRMKEERNDLMRARDEAERRAAELAARPPEIPEELLGKVKEQQDEIDRQTELNKTLLEEASQLRRECAQMEQDMQDQQAAFNRAQEELLNFKSAQKRGDAERKTADDLTLDAFSAAVREFMGLCARMPYMSNTFSTMPAQEKRGYEELLRTVEGWAASARRALDTYAAEGGTVS